MQRTHSFIFIILLPVLGSAQSTLDTLLASIAKKNHTILAQARQQEAHLAAFRTGLSLPDPELTLDWMQGFPSSAGSQTDLTAAQAFDFPTAYQFRRKIASLKSEQTTSVTDGVRRAILLEAKQLAIDLISLNKTRLVLERRRQETQAFYEDYQNKLDQQDATILDVRKAQLRLLNIQTELELVDVETESALQKLTLLNGGEPVSFSDTIYPEVVLPPDIESIIRQAKGMDPELQTLLAQQHIAESETQLTRALLLPGFEAGYRYQGMGGQNFHGVHAGIRVPLWENQKRLTASRLQEDLAEARITEQHAELESVIRRQYNAYHDLQEALDIYARGLREVSSQSILIRALSAGQITALDYFMETSVLYETQDHYLELEASIHKLVANLLQYRL